MGRGGRERISGKRADVMNGKKQAEGSPVVARKDKIETLSEGR